MPRNPGEEGTTVGQIKTPMCSENVDRQNTPGTHSYSNTFDKDSPGGGRGSMTTSGTIEGPGKKGEWKKP
jgi:hypothetical protein